MDLAPDARPAAGRYVTTLVVDGRSGLGGYRMLEDPTTGFVGVECGDDTGAWPEGDHTLYFEAGPPGDRALVRSDTITFTLECPEPPASPGAPEDSGGCSVSSRRSSSPWLLGASFVLALIARRRVP